MPIGSFSAGLSGLSANSTYLNVIGNNLANINTIGFKSSAVTFEDVVSQAVGGSSNDLRQIGLGVTTGSISPVFSQGSIENTREATNVAIQGQGFFVVNAPTSGATAYTRAGNFSFSNNGTLVSPDGYRVQGYTQTDPVTGRILTTGVPTDIVLPPGLLRDPTPTTLFRTVSNLDASAAVGATFTASVQIYDSLGTTHVMTITYTKTAANAWGYAITVPGADVNPPPAGGAPAPVAAGNAHVRCAGPHRHRDADRTVNRRRRGHPGPLADVTFTAPVWANGAQSRHDRVGHRGRQPGCIDYRIRGALGDLVQESERLGGRYGGQRHHHVRRVDSGDVRIGSERGRRAACARELQQSARAS